MTQAIKMTFLIAAIIIGLYILEVRLVIAAVNGFADHWNYATVYITTFKDRHPWIMLFMPFIVVFLLWTMKGDPDYA